MRNTLFPRHTLAFVFALLQISVALAQTFDAGVIRRSTDAPGVRIREEGGPGTETPGRYRCSHCPLLSVIRSAYSVDKSQIAGPSWIESEQFDVTATLNPSTTKAQFKTMLRTLLIQSLDLQAHRESRQVTGYDLVVARRPIKMKPAPESADNGRPWVQFGPTKTDAEGFPILPEGFDGPIDLPQLGMGGRVVPMRYRANQTMAALAKQLSKRLKCPVQDNTGLTGRFQVSFEYSEDASNVLLNGVPVAAAAPADGNSGPEEAGVSLTRSLQERMGLKIVSKKVPWEVIVIDRVSRVPRQQ
jgi:uncharacterized protein (TIGR03435 family)